MPFSVIVSFNASILAGKIYACRSTSGCIGADSEENAEKKSIKL